MKKMQYTRISVRSLDFEFSASILAASIKEGAKVTTPRGQKVTEIDVSTKEFSHDWDISEP